MTGLCRAAANGTAIYGECGGYIVLGESLIDRDGRSRRMSGLLPLVTSFAERRLHLGYRRAILRVGTPFGAAGAGFRGHEFHYATVVREGAADPLFSVFGPADENLGTNGLRQESVFGSFIHLIDHETA
jgi:cobyrinic acid a,c-diamide synthase